MSQVLTSRHDVHVPDVERLDSALAELFKKAFRNHPLGVALVTADPGAEPIAMTVSSLSSVSVAPPVVSFSASAISSSTPVLERADTIVIHMLGAEQLELAKLGATSGVDRYADTSAWRRLPTGEPVFRAADTWLRGRILHRLGVGGSVVYLVHVVEGVADATAPTPLVYHNRTWHRLDHASTIA